MTNSTKPMSLGEFFAKIGPSTARLAKMAVKRSKARRKAWDRLMKYKGPVRLVGLERD